MTLNARKTTVFRCRMGGLQVSKLPLQELIRFCWHKAINTTTLSSSSESVEATSYAIVLRAGSSNHP